MTTFLCSNALIMAEVAAIAIAIAQFVDIGLRCISQTKEVLYFCQSQQVDASQRGDTRCILSWSGLG